MTSNAYRMGESDQRPWGSWRVVDVGERFVVKRVIVQGGQRLSLQRHRWRAERWIIVSGSARVWLAPSRDAVKEPRTLGVGEVEVIPPTFWHRVANPGKVDLVFVEVQVGERLDENDIERGEDDYGRT